MIKLTNLFPSILTAALSALLFSFLVRHFALRWGLIDTPGSAPHKQHQNATPLGGGISLLLALWGTMLCMAFPLGKETIGILLGGTFIALWGLWDDFKRLSPLFKMLVQILSVVILVIFGVQVQMTTSNLLNLAITAVWIIGLTNAFNFVDSMDGLAIGLAAIAAGFFMLVTVDSNQPSLAVLCAVIAGASIGMTLLNTRPAKLFLGDSGAQLLGFLLASIGMAYNPVGLPQGISWFVPILVLGVPIFDMSFVVSSRLRRGVHIYQAGMDHTYHRLVHMGIESPRAVLTMHLVAGGLGLVAFIALDTSILVANLIFGCAVLAGILCILIFEKTGHFLKKM